MKRNNLIKIPKNVTVLYDKIKKIIVFMGSEKTKSFNIKLQISLKNKLNTIEVTDRSFTQIANNQQKVIKAFQGTTNALIKQLLIETSYTVFEKLKFVGVGYKSFKVEKFKNKLLMFKLGYSHSLYFKIPEQLIIFCLKFTKLFIYGNSYQNVTQIASLIRSYKKPEPYKGKGILYETEKILLKEGKKI
jgi:large subunit ribosomal protein L6